MNAPSSEYPILPGLPWQDVPADEAARLISRLLPWAGPAALRRVHVTARTAALPFYARTKIVVIHCSANRPKGRPLGDLFALLREDGTLARLDGSSDPVHDNNEYENLKLTPDHEPDYIRFFLFAVRGDEGPFIAFEHRPALKGARSARTRELAGQAHPITAAGFDSAKRSLWDTTIVYAKASFKARFALARDGVIEMVDDDPLAAEFPLQLLEHIPPDLEMPSALRVTLATKVRIEEDGDVDASSAAGATSRRGVRRSPSERSVLVELVELLLERALTAQADNRLLAWFNAKLAKSSAIDRFSTLVRSAAPMVIIESVIPFVEETIADIVKAGDMDAAFRRYQGMATSDANGVEALGNFVLHDDPGVVLLPLQVYGRVLEPERVAYEITRNKLAAFITCERSATVPEAFRRRTDIVLSLPELDEDSFEVLFERALGASLPRNWRRDGTQWVKFLLHTDLEHPRRMKLAPTKALAWMRGQVSDRLRAVQPASSMRLGKLEGMTEARQFAEDLIADIHAATRGDIPWEQVDRGALFVGPPGTGKTTLARAIALECGVKFVHGSAATWMAEGVSLGPHIQAIRRTFAEARRYAPSILFIDEIDSLGNREQFARDNNVVYQTEVVNAVLEQMQGLDPTCPVMVIGATNHLEMVDPALRRSGRLDRIIHIPLPNRAALALIYDNYVAAMAAGTAVADDIDTSELASISVGLTGADVERITRGAARRARKSHRPLSQEDLLAEITDKPRGATGAVRLTTDEVQQVAIHEAGHALASYLGASGGARIGFVSVVPRPGGQLGANWLVNDERQRMTRVDYDEEIEVALGGRAAEEIWNGQDGVSGGAHSDLERASHLALWMVANGMSNTSKLLVTDGASEADRAAAEAILRAGYERTMTKLKSNRKKLVALVNELVSRQELSGAEVRAVLAGRRRQ